MSRHRKLQIYKACVVSKLLYNLSTLWLTDTHMNSIDTFHYRCLRSIANIPTTWGAMQIGIPRTSNEAVRDMLGETLLSDEVRLHRLKLLGHILRRPQEHSARIVSFDARASVYNLSYYIGETLLFTIYAHHYRRPTDGMYFT